MFIRLLFPSSESTYVRPTYVVGSQPELEAVDYQQLNVGDYEQVVDQPTTTITPSSRVQRAPTSAIEAANQYQQLDRATVTQTPPNVGAYAELSATSGNIYYNLN